MASSFRLAMASAVVVGRRSIRAGAAAAEAACQGAAGACGIPDMRRRERTRILQFNPSRALTGRA
jgi:hypothetical protein